MGFALVWHIWWLVILGFIGAWGTFVVFAWRDENEIEISADEARRLDDERRQGKAQMLGLTEGQVA
jgi:cytochrome o ubiquinol oxidase subunit 1